MSRDMGRSEEYEDKGYSLMMAYLLLAIALICVFACSCTRTIYEPIEKTVYHTDTLRLTNVRVDSIVQRDSVAVYVNGDTIRITKYRDRLQYRDRIDTIYKAKVDTARIEIPIEIEKKLTRWEKVKMDFGGMAIGGIFALLVGIAIFLFVKRKSL